MAAGRFALRPFDAGKRPHRISIAGSIVRRGDILTVRCALRGELSALAIPAPAAATERRERLWEGTCLELFLAAGETSRYWEVNLSPAGHWDVYRFAAYREGMARETAVASLPFAVRREPGLLRFALDWDIGTIVAPGSAVAIGIAAVVATRAGDIGHWALTHPGDRPDFHRRDGFALLR